MTSFSAQKPESRALTRRGLLKSGTMLTTGAGFGLVQSEGCVQQCPEVPECPTRPGFRDMNFVTPALVALDYGSGPVLMGVLGNLSPSAEGIVDGTVTVSWMTDPQQQSQISISNNLVQIRSGNSTLELPAEPTTSVVLDGESMELSALLASAVTELQTSADAREWSLSTRSVVAITSLVATSDFQANLRVASSLNLTSFWCTTGCIIAGTIVGIVLVAGCATILAGCAAADVVTIGGVTVPCAWVVAVCAELIKEGIITGAVMAIATTLWYEYVWSRSPNPS